MKKILILGGSGFLGRHLCEKLTRLQQRVTVPTRRADHAAAIQHLPGLTVVQTDVLSDENLNTLVAGHDSVVNLVAILHGNAAAFHQMHVALPEKLAKACMAQGVRRLVHVSALGAATHAPSMYQRSKADGEAVLQAAGLDLTLLRPSVIFGDGDHFLNVFAQLQHYLPVVPLAGAKTKFQPVWVEDVAQAIVNCLLGSTVVPAASTVGKTYEACGPDVLTLQELVRYAGAVSGVNQGRGRAVLPLPDALARLQVFLMSLLPGQPLISQDNLDAMKTDNISAENLPGLVALGINPSALAAVVPAYLGQQTHASPYQHLRRTAGRF